MQLTVLRSGIFCGNLLEFFNELIPSVQKCIEDLTKTS